MAIAATYFILIPVVVGIITYLAVKPKPEQTAIKTRAE